MTEHPGQKLVFIQLLTATSGILGLFTSPGMPWTTTWFVISAWLISLLGFITTYGPQTICELSRQPMRWLFEGYLRSRFVSVLIVFSSVAELFTILSSFQRAHLISFILFIPLVLIWPWISIIFLTKILDSAKHRAVPFFPKLVTTLTAGVFCIILLEVLLRLAFKRLPRAITHRMPQAPIYYGINYDTSYGAREYPAREEVNLLVDYNTGDLFSLTCLRPSTSNSEETYTVHYIRDDHGFRNTVPWPTQVDLVLRPNIWTVKSG